MVVAGAFKERGRFRYLVTACLAALCSSILTCDAQNCSSDDPAYHGMIEPLHNTKFYWSTYATTLSGKVVHSGAVWVGVAFSTSGSMVGSDAIIGLPSDSTVMKYNLNGYATSFVVLDSAQTLTGNVIQVSDGGVTTMLFTKLLVEPGETPIEPEGEHFMLFAYGSGPDLAFHARMASVRLNLASCSVGSVPKSTMDPHLVKVHGTLMITAWMIMLPAGSLFALFKGAVGPTWIYVHLITQLLGVLLMLGSIIVIELGVNDAGREHMNSSDTTFGIHTILAVEALSLAGFLTVIGLLRPRLPGPGEIVSVSRRVFEVLMKGFGHLSIVIALFAILSGESLMMTADSE